jgi:hypothetical protein
MIPLIRTDLTTLLNADWKTSIGIGIGHGLSLVVKENIYQYYRKLVIETTNYPDEVVDLGVFTKDRIDSLIEYLQRLRVHALD